MIGDFLYSLSDKEALSQPAIQRFLDNRSLTSALATNRFDWDVPLDYAARLDHIKILADTAGVTTIAQLDVLIADPVTLLTICALYSATGFGGVTRTDTLAQLQGNLLPTPVWVMPTERISVVLTYSAGAAGNRLIVDFLGMLVPKGSLQFGSIRRV